MVMKRFFDLEMLMKLKWICLREFDDNGVCDRLFFLDSVWDSGFLICWSFFLIRKVDVRIYKCSLNVNMWIENNY